MTVASSFQHLLRMWLKHSNADEFDNGTWHPGAAQEEKLREICTRNAGTEFGHRHSFDRIRTVGDYRAAVPPQTYDTLAPFIDRVTKGEANVLTADDPLLFATTSGTTGAAKYIPVTPSYLQEYSHGIHVHTYRLFSDFPDLLEGKVIVSSSNDEEGRTPGGVPYGAISGYLTRTQPAVLRRYFVLPYEVCRIKDIESKYYLTLRHALAADVRGLMTPNPSSLLLLAESMRVHADELIEDIRRGTVNPAYLPAGAADGPATRGQVNLPSLTAGLVADPRRAAELTACVRATGRLVPAEAWPNLRVVTCWKGGTMPLYLRKLPEHFGDVPVRDMGYMASEGRGATPLVNAGAAGVLNVTSHFFEFVPAESRDSADPEFLTAEQLESDHEYYVYLTTSAGLYRYDINDLIRVVDFYRRTPVIQFVRKGQGISSITGEKLTEAQVTAALVEVVDRGGFDVDHVTACVEWGEPPCYALYCESARRWPDERCRQFLLAIDAALSAGNIEYEAKRTSLRLGMPVLK
ncbi:MAG: GH3 auxin-responsive promoter family protein, partial [Actinobacteria bacterium]|nr:GH3 auxin-responsive promoter family protein [Actinomycetota bacterium]